MSLIAHQQTQKTTPKDEKSRTQSSCFFSVFETEAYDKVVAYMKVLHNVRKIKGFSPKIVDSYNNHDGKTNFDLEGNSNGINFSAYAKRNKLKKSKDILYFEVKLTNQKAIRAYTNEEDTAKRIIDLSEKSNKIFLDTFVQIVPFGDFYKKNQTVEFIERNVRNKKLKSKMLRLLELIPEKKSLYLAQKVMHDRNIEKIIKKFAEINISPVTISKRHGIKKLNNLYEFLLTDSY